MRITLVALTLLLAFGSGTLAEAKNKVKVAPHAKVKVTRHKSSQVKPTRAKRLKIHSAHH